MAIKLSELKAMEEVVTTAPETLTARQVAGQAVTNIPSSALQYGKDIFTAVTDPIGTAKSIGELGLGIIQLAIPGEQASEQIELALQTEVERIGNPEPAVRVAGEHGGVVELARP